MDAQVVSTMPNIFSKSEASYPWLFPKCVGMITTQHKLFPYHTDPKFSDRQAWANSADPAQTLLNAITVYTVCHSSSHFLDTFYRLFVCLFDLGLTSLSTIFQSYRDGVWMWQGAQCSLLECCLTEISCPRHFDMIFHSVTLYWHWADQFRFLALLS